MITKQRRHGTITNRRGALATGILDLVVVAFVAAHLAGGAAVGASDPAGGITDPVGLLGTRLGPTACPSVPLAVGEGINVICPDWTAVTSLDGTLLVVSLYGPGNSVVNAWAGPLPQGLTWGDDLSAVLDTLGRPRLMTPAYGTPTLVYMYNGLPYGSLELRFDEGDHLMRVNASTLH